MIPAELISAGGSAVLGGALKLMALKMENSRQAWAIQKEKTELAHADVQRARAFKGGAISRRLIVISVMLTVFIAPILTAWLAPWIGEIPVYYGYTEGSARFFGLFGTIEETKFVKMEGLVLLPVHTHMASSLAGFYFGAGIVKSK